MTVFDPGSPPVPVPRPSCRPFMPLSYVDPGPAPVPVPRPSSRPFIPPTKQLPPAPLKPAVAKVDQLRVEFQNQTQEPVNISSTSWISNKGPFSHETRADYTPLDEKEVGKAPPFYFPPIPLKAAVEQVKNSLIRIPKNPASEPTMKWIHNQGPFSYERRKDYSPSYAADEISSEPPFYPDHFYPQPKVSLASFFTGTSEQVPPQISNPQPTERLLLVNKGKVPAGTGFSSFIKSMFSAFPKEPKTIPWEEHRFEINQELTNITALPAHHKLRVQRLLAYIFDQTLGAIAKISSLPGARYVYPCYFKNGFPIYLRLTTANFENLQWQLNLRNCNLRLLFCEIDANTLSDLVDKSFTYSTIWTSVFRPIDEYFKQKIKNNKANVNFLSTARSSYLIESVFPEFYKIINESFSVAEGNFSIVSGRVRVFAHEETVRHRHVNAVYIPFSYQKNGATLTSSYYHQNSFHTESFVNTTFTVQWGVESYNLESITKTTLSVPRELDELLAFPIDRYASCGLGEVRLTNFAPRLETLQVISPCLKKADRSAKPLDMPSILRALSEALNVSLNQFYPSLKDWQTFDVYKIGSPLQGFPIHMEISGEAMAKCFLPLLIGTQVKKVNFTFCPPQDDVLVEFFNNFGQHQVEEIILTRPLTLKEELAMAQQAEAILERCKTLAHPEKYSSFIKFHINPNNPHPAFISVLQLVTIEDKSFTLEACSNDILPNLERKISVCLIRSR